MMNSVALAPLIQENARVGDVGSGAGLPGIPLALARPDVQVTLIEPLLRRTVFLEEVITELGLPNATVIRGRAEEVASCAPRSFDVVTARAVARMEKLAKMCCPLVAPGGQLLAIKGISVSEELQEFSAPGGFAAPEVLRLPVPEGDEQLTVVRMSEGGRAMAGEGGKR